MVECTFAASGNTMLSRGKAFVLLFELWVELDFPSRTSFYLPLITDKQTVIIQTWAFGKHFLLWSDSHFKVTDSICC